MIKVLLKQKWYISLIFALILAEPSLNSVLNFWLQGLFNTAGPGLDKMILLRMLTVGFLLWIFKRIVSYASGLLKARYICNAKQEVKHRMFVSLLGLNTSNLAQRASSGEYISLFVNDMTLIEQRFFEQIISLISSIFSIVILGSSFFVLNAKLAVSILLFGVAAMLVPVAFSKSLNEKNLYYSRAVSGFTQKIKEYFAAYPTIKNYAVEREILGRFVSVNEGTEDAKFEADAALTLANNVGSLLSWFMQFIAVGFGLMLVVRGEILVGTVIAAQAFANDLGMPLQSVIVSINSIRSVREIVRKIEAATGTPEQCEVQRGGEQSPVLIPEGDVEIEFDDLSLEIGEKKDHRPLHF